MAPRTQRAGEGSNGAALSVGGFTAIRIRFPLLPFVRVLFVKLHRSKKSGGDDELPADRTLFVANAEFGEAAIRTAFETFGEVERVVLGSLQSQGGGGSGAGGKPRAESSGEPGGAAHAHVVFAKKQACKQALASGEIVELGEEVHGVMVAGLGGKAWAEAHREQQVEQAELQASVDIYMEHFDERSEEEKRRRKDKVVDEDGFEVVTYKRKEKLTAEEDQYVKPKKSKELQDFYRFQVREKKREELASLRAKFEADKRRVAAMKARRSFRPV